MVKISQEMMVPLLLPVWAERIASAIVKLLQISTAVLVAPNFTSSRWLPVIKCLRDAASGR